jgi:NADH-quinone oxidoreductase subunit N
LIESTPRANSKSSGSKTVQINYLALLPEIILSIFGIGIMLAVPYVPSRLQARLGLVALVGFLAAAGVALAFPSSPEAGRMLFHDGFGTFCKILFIFSGSAVTAVSMNYLERDGLLHGEFFSLLLFATVGMGLMANSADLIMTFLGLEILSISTYVLAGFKRNDIKSGESALKYFLLGSLSTGFLLYGIAFLYGATGTTRYIEMSQAIAVSTDRVIALLVGLGLVVVGFGFKAAIVPFHIWTPDVYEGAPVPVTAHLAVASKAAAFLAFVRILYQVLPDLGLHWQTVLWVSAFLTMALGNIVALTQTNIKRMLAYSSIAHAGYLLIGLVAHNTAGVQAVLFYFAAYAMMTLGAFAVVQFIGREQEQRVALEDYAGIGYRHPFLAAALSVFLISLAGIPATAGFMGKLFLFTAAIQSRLYWLVVIALLTSAIGLYYYLRIIVLMYMREPHKEEAGKLVLPLPAVLTIAIMLGGTLYLGIFPGAVLRLASEAASF